MGESEESSSSSSWRFSMELLSHVHTLQAFLFHSSSQVKPDQDCLSLQAVLLCAPPSLLCSWKTPRQARLYALRLPLPLLLFDYSASPRISALPDSIQISLPLLPLSPFHLQAFSSLTLAHDGIHSQSPDGTCVPDFGVQHEAINGIYGDNGSSHSRDEDKYPACIDTHETGTSASDYTSDNIPRNEIHAAADGHGDDDAHKSHKTDDNHAVEGFRSPVYVTVHVHGHQKHELDGINELQLVATPAVNKCDCDNDCVQEEHQAGNSIQSVCQHAVPSYDNICGHGQHIQGPYHKDDVQAHGTHELRRDAATASNIHGCQNDSMRKVYGTHQVEQDAAAAVNFYGCHDGGMRKVHVDSLVNGNENSVCVNSDAYKSQEHNNSNEIWHVASPASDISGCHCEHGMNEVEHDAIEAGEDIHRACSHAVHEYNNICRDDPPTTISSACFQHTDGIKVHKHHTHCNESSFLCDKDDAFKSCLQCRHGRSAADLRNNDSFLSSQHHDLTVLDSLTHQGLEDLKAQGATTFYCKACSGKVSKNPVRNLMQLPCFDWREIVENWFGACCCSFGSEAEILSASFEKSLKLRPGKCLVGFSTFYVNFSDVTVETKPLMLVTDDELRQLSTLHFLALGNGFMVWENQQSKYYSWLPVYCTCCASLLGAYACKSADSGSIREGLHLFRCQIMSVNEDGTLEDMLRYATFKELLAKELRLRSEENNSYRFLIRSLSSQLPLLQLVVLDYDSLICTGNVAAYQLDLVEHLQTTNEMPVLAGESRLQPSIKVQFLDCSGLSADEIRSIERWVQDYDAETIFMLEEFVNVLKGELLSNKVFYPAHCGLSQVFHGSFIHMSQE